jgi:hypothetical protein
MLRRFSGSMSLSITPTLCFRWDSCTHRLQSSRFNMQVSSRQRYCTFCHPWAYPFTQLPRYYVLASLINN